MQEYDITNFHSVSGFFPSAVLVAFPQLKKVLLSPTSPEMVQHIVEMLDSPCGLSRSNVKVFIIKWATVSEMQTNSVAGIHTADVRGLVVPPYLQTRYKREDEH